jgi:hypothetical protein
MSARRSIAFVAWGMLLVACTTGSPSHRLPGPNPLTAPASPSLPPVPNVDWRIPASESHGIAGYASTTSVMPGQSVDLYVSTKAARFSVLAFRMGYYGKVQGHLIAQTGAIRGVAQRRARVQAPTNTVIAPWTRSLTISTTAWPPGMYLLRLDASDGTRSFVPLAVRAPSARGRVVLVSPVTTWQAYNRWGCCNLYAGADGAYATRSRAVSFDRPYEQEAGAGEFIERELPVVVEAERLHLRLDYVTSIDLARDPNQLAGASAIVSMGHDEYWSPGMRAAVTALRDAGTNVMFLGANAVYRRIRFAASALGPARVEIDYKSAAEDPLLGHNNAAVTSDWAQPPNPRPGDSLVGESYNCFTRLRTPGVVVDAASPILHGTGLTNGQRLPRLIGPETDRVTASSSQPHPVEILMHSPFPCPPTDADSPADTSYSTAPNGAGTFDAGTMSWVCAMSGHCAGATVAHIIRVITDNLLRTFASGPAGLTWPATDNCRHVRAC